MTNTYLEKLTAHLNASIEQFVEKERGKGYTTNLISHLKDGDIFVIHDRAMRRYAVTVLHRAFLAKGKKPPVVQIVHINDLDDRLVGEPPETKVYFDHFTQLRAVQRAIARAADCHKNNNKHGLIQHLPHVWKG